MIANIKNINKFIKVIFLLTLMLLKLLKILIYNKNHLTYPYMKFKTFVKLYR